MKIVLLKNTFCYQVFLTAKVEYIDKEDAFLGFDIEFQLANGKYIPANHPYFCFVDSNEITAKYNSADIIITHAGYGT